MLGGRPARTHCGRWSIVKFLQSSDSAMQPCGPGCPSCPGFARQFCSQSWRLRVAAGVAARAHEALRKWARLVAQHTLPGKSPEASRYSMLLREEAWDVSSASNRSGHHDGAAGCTLVWVQPYIIAALDAVLGRPSSCLGKGLKKLQATRELGSSMDAFMTASGCFGSLIRDCPSYLRWLQMYHNIFHPQHPQCSTHGVKSTMVHEQPR